MPVSESALQAFRNHCPGAKAMEEGGRDFVHLPALRLPSGTTLQALILLNGTGSYPTRLLLADPIERKTAEKWEPHVHFGRTWHTWSWKDIPGDLPIAEILLSHLEAFQ